jgi:nucleoid DNA-binding protein
VPHIAQLSPPLQWNCSPNPDILRGIGPAPHTPTGQFRSMVMSTAKKPAAPKSAAPQKTSGNKAAAFQPAKATISAPKVATAAQGDASDGPAHATEKPEAGPQVKKKDLIARVVAALDGKKKGQVKDIVEATLAALGEALQNGESLNLPPFGRARIARSKGEGKASSMTVKLRGAGAKNAPKAPKEALAEVGEDD